jgi:hypothetical protein
MACTSWFTRFFVANNRFFGVKNRLFWCVSGHLSGRRKGDWAFSPDKIQYAWGLGALVSVFL